MGKKKKGGKEKGGKGEGGEKKLPPPPNLDDQRDAAQEALLSFQIRGKEELIDQYEEEAEVFKDRNHHQSERNHQLKVDQMGHYRMLVQQAREYEQELDRAEATERERVDEALWEKLQFARRSEQELLGLQDHINEVEKELKVTQTEVEKWQHYRDVIQNERRSYIATMRQQMEDMERGTRELESELQLRLAEAKLQVEGRIESLVERQRELICQRLLQALDKETQAEMADNAWLKKEIAVVQGGLEKLQEEADALELRNLKLMETVYRQQIEELETTRELYRSSTGHRRAFGGTGSGTSLPSLVDLQKCTSNKGPGGQLGQMEMKLLSVHGAKVSLALPPETVHLPPIEEQRSTHTALPPRTTWPITSDMLKSIV